ncbi:methyl-accepting chemotaxis protein [Tumebacillus permanentifrigoris]|uniref:Methyl-accepting chemotaxis protein n=1 Tax=Tumebacillus permanentifrigoris TaxID=378543 RepID=A0A316DGV1_9BACL|nr:HAMP domain-containing methyl-accepting chemotaxis protein [Tumebacillus permanentifrigoris]PWK16469.1 methyl-accepting chemotaxis protein [Tumebacillus permanentifrigoris]
MKLEVPVARKIYIGFLIVLILLATVAGIGYFRISLIDKNYSELIQGRLNDVMITKDIVSNISERQKYARGYLLVGDESYITGYTKANQSYVDLSNQLEKSLETPEEKKIFNEMNAIHTEHEKIIDNLVALKKENKVAEYTQLVKTQCTPVGEAFIQKAEELLDYQANEAKMQNVDLNNDVAFTKKLVLILSISSLLIGLGDAFLISRMLSRPVRKITGAAEQIAAGDLSGPDPVIKNRDEIGELAHHFSQMKQNIRVLLEQVTLNSQQVAATSEEVTASSELTSQVAENVAQSVQEIAIGADRQVADVTHATNVVITISEAIAEVSSGMEHVTTSSADAKQTAADGNQVIVKSIEQMNVINHRVSISSDVVNQLGEKSKEIGGIVSIIRELANQTNLLALNAAIEAARAGEQGKGFAVVADEVRKLAEESGSAATQIATIIGEIQRDTEKAMQAMNQGDDAVKEGLVMIQNAGEAFHNIMLVVDDVSAQTQRVSERVQEANKGTKSVVELMEGIAQVSELAAENTQTVAASVQEQTASMEEISTASTTLSSMAEELQQSLSKFKL